MEKNVVNRFVVVIAAGRAVTGPPLGPVLGQYGINAVMFSKQFNELSAGLDDFDDFLVNVSVRVDLYDDRTFGLFLFKPSVSSLLKLVTGITQGSSGNNRPILSKNDVVRVALFKFPAMNLGSSCFVVLNAARSMGLFLAGD